MFGNRFWIWINQLLLDKFFFSPLRPKMLMKKMVNFGHSASWVFRWDWKCPQTYSNTMQHFKLRRTKAIYYLIGSIFFHFQFITKQWHSHFSKSTFIMPLSTLARSTDQPTDQTVQPTKNSWEKTLPSTNPTIYQVRFMSHPMNDPLFFSYHIINVSLAKQKLFVQINKRMHILPLNCIDVFTSISMKHFRIVFLARNHCLQSIHPLVMSTNFGKLSFICISLRVSLWFDCRMSG